MSKSKTALSIIKVSFLFLAPETGFQSLLNINNVQKQEARVKLFNYKIILFGFFLFVMPNFAPAEIRFERKSLMNWNKNIIN